MIKEVEQQKKILLCMVFIVVVILILFVSNIVLNSTNSVDSFPQNQHYLNVAEK